MQQSPLVSVIIPAHNGQQRIARAVNSIIQQDYTNWEIVIISDDQQDYERILADKGIRSDKMRFYSTGRVASGAGNARNVGFQHANGDVIALLDCDDTFHPLRLSSMLPLVREYGAAVSNIKLIDEDENTEIPNISLRLNSRSMLPDQVFFCFYHAQNVSVFDRKKITHSYIPLERYEDNIFLMQMYNFVDAIGYLPESYYHYYKYQGTSTSFSIKQSEVSEAFLHSARAIRDEILHKRIYFKSDELMKTVCESMDCAIASQLFFLEAIKQQPDKKYCEIMKPFFDTWPLPQSLVAS